MPDKSLEKKDVVHRGHGQGKLDLEDKGSKHKESKDKDPKIGKIDLNTFQSFLLKRLGKEDKTVLGSALDRGGCRRHRHRRRQGPHSCRGSHLRRAWAALGDVRLVTWVHIGAIQ